MDLATDNVIGIVGGMGPQAGMALFNSIIANTNASTDQQHLPVVLMSYPGHIVDRTAFLEGSTAVNPAYSIVEIIMKLEKAGANTIGIACNTVYSSRIYRVILEELNRMNSAVNIVNMPLETCRRIREQFPLSNRVGVMSTNGTYRSAVYNDLLQDWGYDVIIPDPAFQNDVIHRMIYDQEFGLKANGKDLKPEAGLLLDKTLDFFSAKGADTIVLGCTDLSWDFKERVKRNIQIIDSTEALAIALIRQATGSSQPAVLINTDNHKYLSEK